MTEETVIKPARKTRQKTNPEPAVEEKAAKKERKPRKTTSSELTAENADVKKERKPRKKKLVVQEEPVKIKGISRIDSGNTHGWFVRVYEHGKVRSKFFADKKNGSREIALEEAKNFKLIHDEFPNARRPFYARAQKNGMVRNAPGVSRSFYVNRKGERIYYWAAFWAPGPGQRKYKRFYDHRCGGEKPALEDAMEFRKEKELELAKLAKSGQRS